MQNNSCYAGVESEAHRDLDASRLPNTRLAQFIKTLAKSLPGDQRGSFHRRAANTVATIQAIPGFDKLPDAYDPKNQGVTDLKITVVGLALRTLRDDTLSGGNRTGFVVRYLTELLKDSSGFHGLADAIKSALVGDLSIRVSYGEYRLSPNLKEYKVVLGGLASKVQKQQEIIALCRIISICSDYGVDQGTTGRLVSSLCNEVRSGALSESELYKLDFFGRLGALSINAICDILESGGFRSLDLSLRRAFLERVGETLPLPYGSWRELLPEVNEMTNGLLGIGFRSLFARSYKQLTSEQQREWLLKSLETNGPLRMFSSDGINSVQVESRYKLTAGKGGKHTLRGFEGDSPVVQQILHSNGVRVPIFFSSKLPPDPVFLNKVYSAMASVPPELLKRASKVVVHSCSGPKGTELMTAESLEGVINIFPNSQLSTGEIRNAFIHECGHLLMLHRRRVVEINKIREDFSEAGLQDGGKASWYGMVAGTDEAFAEMTALYYRAQSPEEKRLLERLFPNQLKVLKKLLSDEWSQ
jgi:hypothetical protein